MERLMNILGMLLLLGAMSYCKKAEKAPGPQTVFMLKPADNLADIDYEIYSLILETNFSSTGNLVVTQETSHMGGPLSSDYYAHTLPPLGTQIDSTGFVDFNAKNEKVYNLGNNFHVDTRLVTLISADEIQDLFGSSDGWDQYYKRYPGSGGTISFSRIGYNTDQTEALVETGQASGSLSGYGMLIYLKKENNSWKITGSVNTWIS
jgi:hypothetical protein